MQRRSLRTLMIEMLLVVTTIFGCKSDSVSTAEKAERIEAWKARYRKSYGEIGGNSLEPEYFAKKLAELLGKIDDQAAVKLFEGLPHQSEEKELLANELATKPTINLHGFPFYVHEVEPNAEHAARLREILSSRNEYVMWGGDGVCGGYHPDWAIVFGEGEEKVEVQLCFGCEDARIYDVNSGIFVEASKRLFDECESILSSYRNERPVKEPRLLK